MTRPFENYKDQPDTAERTRLAVQEIPFAVPKPVPTCTNLYRVQVVQDIQVDEGAECP